MRNTFFMIAVLTVGATAAGAQGSEPVRLQLQPGSEISFTGTSSLHGFTCRTSAFDAQLSVNSAYATGSIAGMARPIAAVTVSIPVRSLTCANKALEKNMLKALKANENATIVFSLADYDVLAASTTVDAFTAQTTGSLTVAGRERTVNLRVQGDRLAGGSVRARGEFDLLMSHFGIKPPTMMLGAIRTGDKVVVRFNLQAGPRAVAAAHAAITAAP